MDQELQFLINTLYGNKLNEKQLSNIIQMWNNNQNGYQDLLRKQAASKMPAGTNKVNPMIAQKAINQVVGTTPKLGQSSYTFDKNEGKAANDLSSISNFNEAFKQARKAGLKTFVWKKTKGNPSGLFSTALASSKPKQVEQPLEEVDDTLDVAIEPIKINKENINTPSWEKDLFEVKPYPFDDFQMVYGNPGQNVYGSSFRSSYKQGGTMNKINYFAQGGTAQNGQADAFMQAVLQGDSDAIGQLIQAANQGDANATKLIKTILQEDQKGNQQVSKAASVIKQLLNQTTSAKWGSKLQYIRSLKFAKGGKNCPACMSAGGSTDENVKVAKKDVDTKTYQRQSFAKKAELDDHRLATETSSNKDGSYNISHKPSAQDSTEIKRSTMSPALNKKYAGKKECGGQAKKHYFGGWL